MSLAHRMQTSHGRKNVAIVIIGGDITDAYSLNHAAFVGLNEVAWTVEFEKELSRRKVYVNKVGL